VNAIRYSKRRLLLHLPRKGVRPMVETIIIIVLAIVAITAVVSLYKLAKTIATKK